MPVIKVILLEEAMELDAFVELALNPLNLERIHYTLKTGKHLKN